MNKLKLIEKSIVDHLTMLRGSKNTYGYLITSLLLIYY